MLDKAISIAAAGHRGQKDKAGKPYILHPMRVMMDMETEEEQICAILHDVVEDTQITLNDLEKYGFSKRVLEALDCLTKREEENYEEYIDRILADPLACQVKLSDLKDNMNVLRYETVGEEEERRLKKYKKAKEQLIRGMKKEQKGEREDVF
jgi:(p)ppGpp synthase/HD superfamily hydrolase